MSNERLLGAWSGASGIARLTYRWDTVRQIVTDIHEGLDSDAHHQLKLRARKQNQSLD